MPSLTIVFAALSARRNRRSIFAILAFALVVWSPAASMQLQARADSSLTPQQSFDLSRLGYVEASEMARRSDATNLSLNFLDHDHVLFTFNPKKLFTRQPSCPATHDDRLIHAAVIDIRNGEVQAQTDWYLHDAHRYLWSLGAGKILLRRLNSLFVVDQNLREKPFWTSPKDLLWVSVTPDGKQIITETEDAPATPKAKAPSKRAFRIEFRDVASLQVLHAIRSEKEANVESASSGFASAIPGGITGTVWLVRFGPDEQQRVNIARVRTRRIPDVMYLSNNTLLIGRDSSRRPGYSVSAFTVTGNLLWRQHWEAHRYFPTLARSEDGSRFAINTLKLVDTPTEASDFEGLEQRIEVFDTASGTGVFSTTAAPVVLQGQNFSLAPDGSRLAVLQGNRLEFFDLPEMTSEERAKYTAVAADVPGLYIAPAPDAAQPTADEPAFTAADVSDEHDDAQKATPADSHQPPPPVTPSTQQDGHAESATVPSQPSSVTPNTGALMTLRSHAEAVALDVVVTDPKGHTVNALPRQDFNVSEDGKPQTVSYFTEVRSHDSPVPVVERKEVAPNIFTNASPPPESDVTLILYDVLNTPSEGQQRAKLELLNFLENKPKDSRFALCVLSETLQMIQGFTPDETLLIKAVKGQKGSLRNTSLRSQDVQDQQTIGWLTRNAQSTTQTFGSRGQAMSNALVDSAGLIAQDEARRQGRDLNSRAWLTMDAFSQLARYLAAIPGRKSLIWISGSFPLGIFPGLELKNTDSTTTTYTEQVKQAVNLLAESHIAVYPVDVRGVTADSLLSQGLNLGDSGPPVASSLSSAANTEMRLKSLENMTEFSNNGGSLPGNGSPYMQQMSEHGIMDKIAADTGGRAFYNTNGIQQAMALALEQETNYYALSYTPTNRKYDGKFRKIKIALAPGDKKLHVVHRSGYFAIDPETAAESSKDASRGFGLAAMQHGSPQAHQVYFEARVVPVGKPRNIVLPVASKAPPSKKKKRQQEAHPQEPVEAQHYVVDYVVTPNQLRFDTNPQGARHGIINFMTTSFDEDATLRTAVVSRAVTDFEPEGFQEVLAGGLRLRQQVDVPVQATWLRLGVQDALSGRLGTVEIRLPVSHLPGVEQSLAQQMPPVEPD